MIIYFSGTGSTKYIAEKLATALDEEAISIESLNEENIFEIELANKEYFGILMPVYAYRLPKYVKNYLSKLIIKNRASYNFALFTYGGTTLNIKPFLDDALKDFKLDAYYKLIMPDTYTPMYPLKDNLALKKLEENVENDIKILIDKIKSKEDINQIKSKMPYAINKIFSNICYATISRTRPFKVSDNCISCSICANNCPDHAIKMEDGKPQWIIKSCDMCLRCFHHCPTNAIDYGFMTKDKIRYKHYYNLLKK